MFVYLIFGVLFAYAVYKERQQLGCPAFPSTEDCDNAKGKPLRGTQPSETDSTDELFGKIKKAGAWAGQWVIWRIGLIIATIFTLLLFFVLEHRLADERELVVGSLIGTFLFVFAMNFEKFHFWDYVEGNINRSVELIEKRGEILPSATGFEDGNFFA